MDLQWANHPHRHPHSLEFNGHAIELLFLAPIRMMWWWELLRLHQAIQVILDQADNTKQCMQIISGQTIDLPKEEIGDAEEAEAEKKKKKKKKKKKPPEEEEEEEGDQCCSEDACRMPPKIDMHNLPGGREGGLGYQVHKWFWIIVLGAQTKLGPNFRATFRDLANPEIFLFQENTSIVPQNRQKNIPKTPSTSHGHNKVLSASWRWFPNGWFVWVDCGVCSVFLVSLTCDYVIIFCFISWWSSVHFMVMLTRLCVVLVSLKTGMQAIQDPLTSLCLASWIRSWHQAIAVLKSMAICLRLAKVISEFLARWTFNLLKMCFGSSKNLGVLARETSTRKVVQAFLPTLRASPKQTPAWCLQSCPHGLGQLQTVNQGPAISQFTPKQGWGFSLDYARARKELRSARLSWSSSESKLNLRSA